MDRHEQALDILARGTVIPAIPLVLDSGRRLDEEGQRRLVRYYLAAGAGGVATAVHTTQFEIRQAGLLEPVLRVAAEEIGRWEDENKKEIVRIAGACGPTPQAVEEAVLARKLGFDAVLLSPGGLGHLTEEQLLERTRQVAEVMPVIGFYLQESVGGRRLSADYWRRLADIDGVVAVKSAPFDRYRTLDLVRGVASSRRGDKVALYTGNDDNIVIDLLTPYVFQIDGRRVEKRFVGGLLGHWSVWTNAAVRCFEKLRAAAGQKEIPLELLTLAAQITDTNAAFFDVENGFAGCIPGVHEALRRSGLMEGTWCLNPSETLSPGQAEEIDRVWTAYPHLTDDAFLTANRHLWEVAR